MVKRITKQKRAEEDAIVALEDRVHQSESDSDSDAPEEESNAIGRRNVKGLDRTRQSAQKRALKVKKPEIVRVDERADADDAMASAADPQIASLSAREASDPVAEASHRLDPALFAESFAKKKSNARPSIESKRAQGEATGAKSEKKRSRLAKGRDGQPMKRLKDGRTTVRVLPKPIRFDDIDDEKEGKTRIEEVISQPILMDPTEILPNAKVRAFKKRKLGLKEASPRLSKATSGKPIRTEDDPLGLEDPSFMKGGEYVKGDRQNPPRNKLSPLKGRRTKFTPAMSKHGQALHFARSL